MKQKKLIKEVYKACIERNIERLNELRVEEFRKIFKHKAEGDLRIHTPKWTVVQL